MAEAVEALRRQGFTADFAVATEADRVTAAGHSYKDDEVVIIEHHRFEGASDPDDSSVLYALVGPDGVKGLLIDAYGAYADRKTSILLKNTKDDHGELNESAA